jgi:thymidine phosphorylase
VVRPFAADRAGILAAVDAEALGRASGELGAGRKRKGDAIDPAVGIVFLPKVGDRLEGGQELGQVHARSEADAETCVRSVLAAIALSDDPVEQPPLVYGWYGS